MVSNESLVIGFRDMICTDAGDFIEQKINILTNVLWLLFYIFLQFIYFYAD